MTHKEKMDTIRQAADEIQIAAAYLWDVVNGERKSTLAELENVHHHARLASEAGVDRLGSLISKIKNG